MRHSVTCSVNILLMTEDSDVQCIAFWKLCIAGTVYVDINDEVYSPYRQIREL